LYTRTAEGIVVSISGTASDCDTIIVIMHHKMPLIVFVLLIVVAVLAVVVGIKHSIGEAEVVTRHWGRDVNSPP
jgi:hypothetical protein